jgi:hypothetical protein
VAERPGMDALAGSDRIRPSTRWLAAFILPFLAVASVLLLVFPAVTDRLFAWTITPPLSAMFLGSAYVGGIWYFALMLRQQRWHRLAAGIPAVLVFATLLAVATLLHWDRFHPGHLTFIVWVAIYCVTPFLVLAAWLANRRADDRQPEHPDAVIPAAIRAAAVTIGAVCLLCGVTLFLAPTLFLDSWAWQLTPLTARVTGAILTLPGLVNLRMLWDARWSSYRWMLQCEIVSLGAIVVSLVVSLDQIAWARPAGPGFVIGIAASLAGFVVLYLGGDAAARRNGAPADATSP